MDLLGIEEHNPASLEALPAEAEGAAPIAHHCHLLVVLRQSASCEPEGVTVGNSPTALLRTRGSRGGKDSIYKNYRRAYYQPLNNLRVS